MRILYGVVGEGMGHATRSMVILKHLVAHHDVQIVVSGRAHAFLRKSFPLLEVHEIAGLNMIYEDNAVQRRRTAFDFLKKLPAFAENFETMTRLSEGFPGHVRSRRARFHQWTASVSGLARNLPAPRGSRHAGRAAAPAAAPATEAEGRWPAAAS